MTLGFFVIFHYIMFAQSSSNVARRARQCLFLLRRLNTCTGKGNIGTFSSQNLLKSLLFSSENSWGFSGNGVLLRALVPLHVQTGFRYFSANSLESHTFQDDKFSELDAKEVNEGEGFKDGSEVEISSQTESGDVQGKPIDFLFKEAIVSEPVDLVFREAIGIKRRPENKRLEFENGGMDDLQPEIKVEKSKIKFGSQREILNTLSGTIDGLESTIKEIERKIATLKNSEKQMTKTFLELEKSLSGKADKAAEESSAETEVPENQEKSAKSEKKKRKRTKKQRLKNKAPGDSGVGSLEHPWLEWVRFLEHLNDSGYLSKALNFRGPIDLRDCNMERLGRYIRFAAQIFAKDHAEISKLLSGSDMRKVALFGCPSVENNDVFAAKRLRSFFSIEQGIACRPCNLKDTCSASFRKVSKVKSLTVEDVVRLLCTFGLNAEKNELSIPDDVKKSVVNLLKELVDFSNSSLNGGQGL